MRILFINLPPFLLKKPQNDLYYLQASMNLGMLAAASAARRKGHAVVAYDWLGPQQYPLQEQLPNLLADFQPDVVGFSIPSGYAEPYLKPFAEIVKATGAAKIVVGGQYHAGFRASEILTTVPEVDAVAMGSGEPIDWDAFVSLGVAPGSGLAGREFPPAAAERKVDNAVELIEWGISALDLRGYAPSIELARGCPYRCSFCSLSGAPERLSRTTAQVITAQLAFWTAFWDELPRVPLYGECPVFVCTKKNLEDYVGAFSPFADRVEWRVQARVDSVDPDLLPTLYSLGLRVIDLGLESASPRMLRLMNKTQNPDTYLKKAEKLIERAHEAGIGIKLNILLYPGEDQKSALETEQFISRHRHRLAGIAAGSTLEYPGTTLGQDLGQLSGAFGTRRVFDPTLAPAGIFPLDLSADFTYADARAWCIRVSRMVMDSRKYFELKRIGYYSPLVTYEAFLATAARAPEPALPFALPDAFNTEPETALELAEQIVGWDKLR